MIIEIPEVSVYKSFSAFSNYIDLYNDKQEENKGKLKTVHKYLFEIIVRTANNRLKRDRRIFLKSEPELLALDTEQTFPIYINTPYLARIMKCSFNTVRNRINKLIEAGAIEKKVLHGRHKNYELHLNTQLLLINDVNNPKKMSKSDFLKKTVECDLQKEQTQNLSQYITIINNLNNNKIMNVSGVDNFADTNSQILKQTQSEITNDIKHLSDEINQENKHKHPKSNSGSARKQTQTEKRKKVAPKKEKSPTDKKAQELRTYKNRIANWLVSYAINLIWKNKEVALPEFLRTVNYIEIFYLGHINSFEELNRLEAEYRWRIDAVARYIDRKDYNMTQYPYQYFHLSNQSSGFVSTQKWYANAKTWYEMKMIENTKKTDLRKMQDAIKRFNKEQTLNAFKREEQYVKDNIPELYNDFIKHFSQNQLI